MHTDDLATADERVELGALPQLVLDALPAGLAIPSTQLVLLQPLLLVARGLDTLVDDGALDAEVATSVAAVGDVAEGVDLE
jgi:hypothetical protein